MPKEGIRFNDTLLSTDLSHVVSDYMTTDTVL